MDNTSEPSQPQKRSLGLKRHLLVHAAAWTLLIVGLFAWNASQVMEDYEEQYGVKGRITSLKPLRSENAPDARERAAMESFERGETEADELTEINGEPYLRLMRPPVAKKSCLGCHTHQGYKEGGIQGGVSVSTPAEPLFAGARKGLVRHSFALGLLWLVGLAGMAFGAGRIQRRVHERERAEAERERGRAFTQTVIDGLPESLMVINPDYTIALANRTAREMAGGKDPVAAGLKCHQVAHQSATPCEGPEVRCPLKHVIATKMPVTVEHIHRDAEGKAIPVETLAAPILDEEGEVAQIVESCRDITARKRAQQGLRESEERYRNLFDNSLVGLFRSRISDGLFIAVNSKAAEQQGLPAEEIVEKVRAADLYRSPDQRKELVSKLEQDGEAHGFEADLTLQDGRDVTFSISVKAYPEKDYIEGAVVDITEHKKAEAALTLHLRFLETMERVSRAIQQANDVEQMMSDVLQTTLEIFEADRAWLLYPCDPEAETWSVPMEHTRAEYPGAFALGEEIPMLPEAADVFREALEKDDVITVDYRNPAVAKETAERFSILSLMHMPVFPRTGKPWLFGVHQCSHYRDWTDEESEIFREIGHRLADALSSLLFLRDLRASEERWRSLTMHSPDHVMLLDCDGTIRFINRTTPDLSIEQVLNTPVFEHIPEDFRQVAADCFKQVAESQEPGTFETDNHSEEGNVRHFETRVAPALDKSETVALILSSRDVTERKRAEEERLNLERQVQHAQKLESLGVLAGGIAHDFNNLLMTIMGNADLALYQLAPLSPARRNIQEIGKATQRAAELAGQMLAYSGKGRFVVESINAGELFGEMAHLLEVSISKKAVLKYNFAENLPAFEGDAAQILQVVMNLITNASEAIGDRSGIIALSTGAMECDRAYLDGANAVQRTSLDEPLPEGVYVFFEVADTGCGMDKETIKKIFDPFFTTKFTGRGLGMAAVLGIVRGHKGAIKIYSEVGKGTTFKVLFPANELPDNGIAGQGANEAEGKDWRATGTVLIADDEETVLAVGRQMLESMGFNVLTAPDGREALRLFREHASEIIWVLLDLTMPHMDGEEAFREMRRLQPGVTVVLCSGYNEQDATQRFAGKGLAGFLQKPYSMTTLKEKFLEILHTTTGSAVPRPR